MDTKDTDLKSMMSSFMQNAQKMQDSLKGAYEQIAEQNKNRTVEGIAGGGLVKVTANLKLEVQNIEAKPEFFEEDSKVCLELIAAATNQAISKAQKMVKDQMLEVTQKMGMPKGMPQDMKFPFGDNT
jgi:DNA-binding YbaB/EbfC family protein